MNDKSKPGCGVAVLIIAGCLVLALLIGVLETKSPEYWKHTIGDKATVSVEIVWVAITEPIFKDVVLSYAAKDTQANVERLFAGQMFIVNRGDQVLILGYGSSYAQPIYEIRVLSGPNAGKRGWTIASAVDGPSPSPSPSP